ncbi:MAG: hypothetical protein ABFC94_00025 [Syntrophomonas sp.]
MVYKKLAQKLSFWKNSIYIGIVLILCVTSLIAYNYVEGVRFDSQRAVKSSRYVDGKSVLLG